MNKVDLHKLASRCGAMIQALQDSEAEVFANTSTISENTKKSVAESTLSSAYVLWEGYLSDLFVGYINRDSSKLIQEVKDRVRSAVKKDRLGDYVASTVTLSLPDHLSAAQARALLDSKDMNITFKNAKEMTDRAAKILGSAGASRFAMLSPADLAALDAAHQIRNYISHQSNAAWKAMNAALAEPNLGPELRRLTNNVSSAGAFLLATPVGASRRRVVAYLDALKGILPKLV